ncbi:hypothetical protein [Fuerstiella marisgermanici]|uniref:Uncharacterized protein n=1 Tax=Fuerstiella marisgermanici TaxID=1891926 RepID=A0A1P8WRA2_9PLAN|nr:hypothetical protein [Fuerstiella marisgermanici]APZ96583.1 hypothetical protein Fuma_06253 [Fuerstiella marisgermanici]
MQTYSDEQFTSLISNGAAPSAVIQAAGENVPFDVLLSWAKSRENIPQKIAGFTAEAKARKAAAENAPVKLRPGRDEGVILKAGKNRGKPGQATGAVLEIAGAPRVFLACTAGQVASVLANPMLSLKLAIEMDRGEHDGRGYVRDAEYSALSSLEKLWTTYQPLNVETLLQAAQQSHSPQHEASAASVGQSVSQAA